ncbi:tetratricopeptide repeat protein [Desulfomonile tiedjei]|uniref:Tetratricopeptide repeat protein n=1 Tax=Desulfomonile tiedjei (strain ATCC 49306 / DSM 6799 / DCB-1) TaxID=706587 RepID=I4CAB8_DESTA|nr:tetratricopeptide repeat protein [Desulfomonile tiedjei]AFM26509.1 tetratricopeptide repeat protein [Desulfomonile tiedjei DSM 6799]
MATIDMNDLNSTEDLPSEEQESFLPAFPCRKAILHALPEMIPTPDLGKKDFISWVDSTLENPDEIWENQGLLDNRFFHYVSYLETRGTVPAFAVEICTVEDPETTEFCLLLKQSDLNEIRNGKNVYCMAKEWEREKFVREMNDRALTKYDEESLDEARELIDTAIRLSGNGSAYLFNNRGLISWKMGKIAQAKKDFIESIKLDEGNGDPYFNIGLIYFDESDYPRALYYLLRAVEINPVDSQFLTELAHLYLEMGREEEAMRLFQEAFKSNPSDPQVDFHLGYYFLYKKHEPRCAVKHFDNGLQKDPHDQFALADLAVAHWILGNHKKSLKIHKILCKHNRLMPYAMSRLVYLNMEMGDYEAALNYYQEALSQNEPFEPEWLHYNAALVYAKTGRPRQALDTLNLAVRAGGEAVVERAMSEKALQDLKRIPDFKKIIRLTSKRKNR